MWSCCCSFSANITFAFLQCKRGTFETPAVTSSAESNYAKCLILNVDSSTLEIVVNYDLTFLPIYFMADMELNENALSIVHNTFSIRFKKISAGRLLSSSTLNYR